MSEWKMVPDEPTEEMMEVALHGTTNLRDMYEFMLAAAPSPWQPIETALKDGTPILARSALSMEAPGVIAWRGKEWRYQADGCDAIESQDDISTDYAVMSMPEIWMFIPER